MLLVKTEEASRRDRERAWQKKKRREEEEEAAAFNGSFRPGTFHDWKGVPRGACCQAEPAVEVARRTGKATVREGGTKKTGKGVR